MKRKELKHYLDKEWKQAGSAFKSFARNGEGEALHQFRVRVKKVRALAQLVSYAGGARRVKKALKPLKSLFSQSGEVRDATLLLELGRSHHASRSLLHEQQQAMVTAAGELRSVAKASLRQLNKSRKNLLRHFKALHRRQIRKFYHDLLGNIAADLNGKDMAARLHDCRKQIKALLYNQKLVHKALDIALNRPYLKALEKAIGKWHDHLLAARRLPVLKAKCQGLLKHARLLSEGFSGQATL